MKTISFKEKYLIFLVMVCFIVIGLYYSYAIFVTKQLQENVVSLRTTESNVLLKINDGNNKVSIKANSEQLLKISLENNSEIEYFYEIYFKGNKTNVFVTGNQDLVRSKILNKENKIININVVNKNSEDVELEFIVKNNIKENSVKEIGYSYINEYNNYDHSKANKPEIKSLPLIPVAYKSTSLQDGYWYKVSADNDKDLWYDYDHGIWANAVLVSNANYSKYQNVDDGEKIEIGDILGFYVWIPKFKYTILNEASYTNFERMNNVIFENETTGTISCTDKISSDMDNHIYSETCFDGINGKIYDNLSTYTHPAFYDNQGFWVSKFLISEGDNLRSIPDATMMKKNISEALSLSSNVVKGKSFLLSNMEYASIVILSNSSYGKSGNSNYYTDDNYTFKRIYNNNYLYDLTGCSSDYTNFSKSFNTNTSKTCISYNDLTNASHIANGIKYNVYEIGPGASTTGTVYGVYDMANIHGELLDAFGTNNLGVSDYSSSHSDLYSYNEYQGIVGSSSSAYNLNRYKLGDAIKENFRTLSKNGMWQGGILNQKEKEGVFLRGGNGEIKNASIYTTSIVDYEYKAPFRISIKNN